MEKSTNLLFEVDMNGSCLKVDIFDIVKCCLRYEVISDDVYIKDLTIVSLSENTV